MKRLVLLFGLTLLFLCSNAQRGYIVYTEYEPDTVLNYDQNYYFFDVDFDGEYDMYAFRFAAAPGDPDTFIAFYSISPNEGTLHIATPWDQELGLGHDTIQKGDAIPSCNNWRHSFDFYYDYYAPTPSYDGFRGYIGTRKKVGESYYYGWIEFKVFWTGEAPYIRAPWLVLYATAFCTIPDYPLLAGQASLDLSIEETEDYTFASVHPNPTTGMVTVTGENLRQAEVVNTLGQQVLSVQGKSNDLHIDMAKLPAGVYLVNITDENGKKCVHKVVKE